MWRIALSASEAQLAAFEAALADGAIALSNFEAGDDWTVEALTAAEPDAAALEARVMVAAAALGVAPPAVAIDGNKLDIVFDKAGAKKVIDSFVRPA